MKRKRKRRKGKKRGKEEEREEGLRGMARFSLGTQRKRTRIYSFHLLNKKPLSPQLHKGFKSLPKCIRIH